MNEKDSREKTQKEEKPSGEVIVSQQEYGQLLAQAREMETLKDKFLRSAADFENAKKRLAKERDDFVKFSQENLIRQLLPVLDNFERALAHAGETQTNDKALKGIVSGIQMVFKQLVEILKTQGLKRLKTIHENFDPHLHEAVGFVHEPGKEDEIVEEVEAGYMLHDRLLRAAKVRVRSSGEKKAASSQEEKSEEIT